MPFHTPVNRIPLSSPTRSVAFLSPTAITDVAERRIENYIRLGVVGKKTAIMGEDVSIKGVFNPPVATDFTEAQKTLNEISATRGDFAQVFDIDICHFMSKLSEIQIDFADDPEYRQPPTLNGIMVAVNGVTLPTTRVDSEEIDCIVGKIGISSCDIGAAIQRKISEIECGKPVRACEGICECEDSDPCECGGGSCGCGRSSCACITKSCSCVRSGCACGIAAVVVAPPPLGGAFVESVTVTIEPEPEPVPYGVEPTIIIESPDVTVRSLDDTIDSGEF